MKRLLDEQRQQRRESQVLRCSGGNEFDALGKSKLEQTKVRQTNT